ncbi:MULTISPECIES: hypothetical protein [unclassified Pseudomonas]|uniref:hypothetical protein n=1 Tax=unclassified Pseudomonas TaxID=196821 RepID=UPI00119B662B|nr:MULTISPECIES: hypothetical protein [unclassified Pseudomonas]TWC17617.1 hypothetical protein FBX99_117111 [Pseudomonas sp. SJZ074]TWC19745.1 hypothetical protein FBY00_105114 [Pseudomonas sp. SJZ075]TWC35355.1 hypothetical protein FBY02_105123 [Pseudomonas sp. SJZ078]TWC35473.1 hypothetical protein FBY06_1175 [Pseudomonas sp. SJZ085]TWC56301.1 hypothetical protein FBY11_105123 [Pseudomonas sp. SJZ124]
MTSKSINVNGEVLTLRQIADRSRAALRSSTSDSGILLDPPIIVGQIVDDLIPKTILDSGTMTLRFKSSDIPDPDDADIWRLVLHKGGVETELDEQPFGLVATRPATLDIPVPTAGLVDDDTTKASTTYEFELVVIWGPNGNWDPLEFVPAEIDRFAPEHEKTGLRLKPEAAVLVNLPAGAVIDDDWLDNNTALELTINTGYEFHREDDRVEVYVGPNYGSGTPIHTQLLTSPGEVSIPKAALPQMDGQHYVWYVLFDVVGNESEPALPRPLIVRRRPRPQLIDCFIPKGQLPDVIDLEDLESDVFLEVPYTTNGQETDRIIPKISNANGNTVIPLTGQLLGEETPNKTLKFLVAINRLIALWGNSTAELPITAEYDFSRGTEALVPSNPTPSALDFTYRGPINPIFPGLENPNMTKVKVVAVGGSGTENHITADDRGKPADISTPMIEAPTTWVPIGDEIAKLWFNGVEVHSEQLAAGTVPLLTFEMLASVIDNAGTGKKIAYWTIEEDGGRNRMRSLPTEVQVDAVRINLPPPRVRLYGSGNFVSCASLIRNTWELPVTVDIDPTHMPANTVVTLKSVGTTDAAGLIPIDGTDYTGTYTITGSETGAIFVKNIEPYLSKIKPIQPPHSSGLPNGFIKIWYEVTIGGVLTPSAEFLNEVSLLNTSYNYCEGTPTK